MNDKENTSGETKRGGIKSRSQLYAMFSPYAEQAIQTLVEALSKGNPAVRVGAAKTILAKLIPDLKATELSGPDGQQLTINLVRDYITSIRRDVSTSDGGLEGSIKIQSSDLASESSEDFNVTREDGTGMP